MNMTKITSMGMKIKAEIITSIHNNQKMKDCILIIMIMIMIQMITNNMAMTLRAIGEINLVLTNLMIIMIMVKMILVNLKTLLL